MIKMIIMFKRRTGMTQQQFKDYRRDVHAPMLFSIPESKLIRKFVVSYPIAALNWPEPSADAVVEGWFDSMDDMNALFSSENFLDKVDPDHPNFIDMTSVQRVVSEEIVVV